MTNMQAIADQTRTMLIDRAEEHESAGANIAYQAMRDGGAAGIGSRYGYTTKETTMPSYEINYPWNYSGERAPYGASYDTELRVRYYVQPNEPDVNLKFDITIEEIWNGEHPLCTDADKECGWYEDDEERLLDWLFIDDVWANGKLLKPSYAHE